MKRSFLRAALCLSLVGTLTSVAVSCSNRDDEETTTSTNASNIDPNNFQGKISSGTTVTLDATKTYQLNGKLLVENGATLIIPAGTKIVAAQGANYLIVDRGGKVFMNGTSAQPIVFEGSENKQGHWGGIVILGNAPTNRSASGTSTSELGDMVYGGTQTNDNSGVMQYVVIKNSGFKYNPEKEFNGLSLFGVGSGTTISHIFITDGADDGIEFFGGNVNVDHLVITGMGDDTIDWTEGWVGTAEYLYAARKKQYATTAEPGNRGIEADTQDTDPNTTFGNGASNPTLKHVTLIGNSKGSESQAMKLRAGTQGKFENMVLSNFNVGLDFETDRTYAWFESGSYIKNVKFENITTQWKAKTAGKDLSNVFTVNNNATGAGNGTDLPTWAKNWTGMNTFNPTEAGN